MPIATDTAGWIESIGAACAAIGTVLAVGVALWQSRSQDRNINKRERRSDLRSGIDRAIASLVGDHAAQRYIARVGAGEPQAAVMVAADNVSAREIEMRAAAASLEFRLGPHDAMVQILDEARAYFVVAYVSTGPALIEKREGPEAVENATAALAEFRKRYERIVEMARERFGPGENKPRDRST